MTEIKSPWVQISTSGDCEVKSISIFEAYGLLCTQYDNPMDILTSLHEGQSKCASVGASMIECRRVRGLDEFWRSQAIWSEATFGTPAELGPIGPLKHLAKEAVEAQKDVTDLSEFADCLLLTFDATRRAGFTYEQLVAAAWTKLEVNKARKWQKPTSSDEAIEHDRSGE